MSEWSMQRTEGAHLTTGMVPEITPVDFEPALVIQVHELVHHGALHMLLAEEIARTENHDSAFVLKATSPRFVARCAENILSWHFTPGKLEMFKHKYDHRT